MPHSWYLPSTSVSIRSAGNPSDLDAVVVDVGPGLYTGIRVGLATAQGLAAAFGIPVIPAVSVDAVALEARTGHRMIWSVDRCAACGNSRLGAIGQCPAEVVKDGSTELVKPDVLPRHA